MSHIVPGVRRSVVCVVCVGSVFNVCCDVTESFLCGNTGDCSSFLVLPSLRCGKYRLPSPSSDTPHPGNGYKLTQQNKTRIQENIFKLYFICYTKDNIRCKHISNIITHIIKIFVIKILFQDSSTDKNIYTRTLDSLCKIIDARILSS